MKLAAKYALLAIAILILFGACGAPDPTAMITQASDTPPLPTETPVPPTPIPPTETPLPPTPTPIPPTETPLPPTPTPIPPTETPLPPTPTLDPMVFELRSPAFGMEKPIPALYTCNGQDVSPPLEWGNPPTGTQSFVLLVDDISAGNLVHWILFNIPPETRSLSEAIPKRGHLSDGRQQGMNHIFKLGYFGPCPMPGPNRYRFQLYALDAKLDLEDGVMRIPLKEAMKSHILAQTELIGIYP